MPKGFRNTNLNQRMPGRRIPPGPPPPPQPTQAGFRPSREKSRPPGWKALLPAEPAEPVKPTDAVETPKEKPAAPKPKKS
ncbi:MAG: hypothetical protein AAB152_12070 [Candidatus Coatesbacteria bacterium]